MVQVKEAGKSESFTVICGQTSQAQTVSSNEEKETDNNCLASAKSGPLEEKY